MPFPAKTVISAARKYQDIMKEVPTVSIDLDVETFWVGSETQWHFIPRFSGIENVTSLARVCETNNWFVLHRSLTIESQRLPLFSRPVDTNTMAMVSKAHTSIPQSPVKYFYDTIRTFGANGFGIVIPMLITGTPEEITENGRQYRLVSGQTLLTYGDGLAKDVNATDRAYFAVSTDSPYYNFLDRGHILFFVSKTGEDPSVFIANQLSRIVYNFAAAYSVMADKLKPMLRQDVFLYSQNSAELQKATTAAEAALPEKYGVKYNTLKQAIHEDFEKNGQNVMVTKFQRGELKTITLNGIKLSADTAAYDTNTDVVISIEAPGIADVILHRMDANGVFDIYQLIEAYITSVLDEASASPKSTTTQGFAEARTWQFRINGMPISLALSTTNTRRKVNGHYINSDELLKVMRRAACFHDATTYDKFLREVERMSLRVHDALSQGVPLKISTLDRGSDYQRPATAKHPKLNFIFEDGKYHVWLDEGKKVKVALRRFVGMLDELKMLNTRTNNGWVSDGSGFGRRDSNWCQFHLKRIIREHAVNEDGTTLVTDEQLAPLAAMLETARSLAEKKSKQLLDSVVAETGAVAAKWDMRDAYTIVGNSGRSYTVEKDTFKVWDTKTKGYVCIVDGRGEMGVGYDALVARLLALKNDTFVVDKIGTLRGGVREAQTEAQTAPVPQAA